MGVLQYVETCINVPLVLYTKKVKGNKPKMAVIVQTQEVLSVSTKKNTETFIKTH